MRLIPLFFLGACSYDASMGAGDVGVTQGGSQDIAFARQLIEEGYVPSRETFTVEGLFSEFDLPINGEACEDLLCPRAATAEVQLVASEEPALLTQLGFATSIQEFSRRPLDAAIAVDVSGSMDAPASSDDALTKLEAVKAALNTMVDQLTADDRMALVAFSDRASMLLPSTKMDEAGRAALRSAINQLTPDGGTNIEAGLQQAYAEIAPRAGQTENEHRVLLLTDAQPNIGGTGLDTFLGLAQYYSAQNIGISAFGVGLDFGAALTDAVAKTRGGNAFYLADHEDIERVFGEEFQYVVSPVAYDLAATITPVAGLSFGTGYGVPTDSGLGELSFGASTLFFSARSGGMGATFSSTGGVPEPGVIATFDLSYLPVGATETVSRRLDVTWAGGDAYVGEVGAADDLGVFKMGSLIDEFEALLAAADGCSGDLPPTVAVERIKEARLILTDSATMEGAEDLADEPALLDQLAANFEAGRCY